MARDKTHAPINLPKHDRILDAAERLLASGTAEFSMRQLADEAGVSFATPFNLFGSKAAITLALSARRIASMQEKLAQAALPEAAIARVLTAVDIAVSVMVASPLVNRAVMGAIGAPGGEGGSVSANSSAFWATALGDGEGLVASTWPVALAVLPDQLAVAFRGVLSFWTAGDIPDRSLKPSARAAAAAVLLGFAGRDERIELLAALQKMPAFGG